MVFVDYGTCMRNLFFIAARDGPEPPTFIDFNVGVMYCRGIYLMQNFKEVRVS